MIVFNGKAHEEFYKTMLTKVGNTDCFYQALFYTVGISSITRQNVDGLFDFKNNSIITEALSEGWQTDITTCNPYCL